MSHHQPPAIFISLCTPPNTYSRCYSTQLLLHLPYQDVDISRCFLCCILIVWDRVCHFRSVLLCETWLIQFLCSIRTSEMAMSSGAIKMWYKVTFSQFDGMNFHLNSKIHRNLLENDWRDLFKQAFAVKIKNLSALTLLLWYLWKFEMVLLLISILISPLD